MSSDLLIFCLSLYLVRLGGFDEFFEQRSELARAPEVLRMPLHGDAEARAGTLDRFDDAIRGGGGDVNPSAVFPTA